jgi:phage recombination protein Bet
MLVRETLSTPLTDDEFKVFLYKCSKLNLDPLLGHIVPTAHGLGDKRRVSYITTVDALRLQAERSGKYAGSDDPVYEGQVTYQRANQKVARPIAATVSVWKIVEGQRVGFTATARWDEYFPARESKQFMWLKMPYLMLSKCAEALALRKGFPNETQGLYTMEEMMQLENMVEDKKTDKKDGQKKDNGHQSIYQRLLDAQNKFKTIGHENEWKILLEDMSLDEIPVSVTDRQKQLLLLKKAIDVFRTLEPIKREVKHTRKRTNQKKTTAKAA